MAEFTYGFGFRPKEYISESLLDLVGKTPMLKMCRYGAAAGVGGNILAKEISVPWDPATITYSQFFPTDNITVEDCCEDGIIDFIREYVIYVDTGNYGIILPLGLTTFLTYSSAALRTLYKTISALQGGTEYRGVSFYIVSFIYSILFVAAIYFSLTILLVGRGAVIDEDALADAINDGTIAGAALDVYSTEPPAQDMKILNIRNNERIIYTPHIAWASAEARQRCIDMAADNIAAFIKGERRNDVWQ
jgi:hypothetical protein